MTANIHPACRAIAVSATAEDVKEPTPPLDEKLLLTEGWRNIFQQKFQLGGLAEGRLHF